MAGRLKKCQVTQEQYRNFFDNQLIRITGAKGLPSKVFLGHITWGLLEPKVKKQMESIPNMEEYDNLKRSDCMAFGKEILKNMDP